MIIDSFLTNAIKRKASDLHLVAGQVPVHRIAGQLVNASTTILTSEQLDIMATELVGKAQRQYFEQEREHDFAYEYDGWRFRVNLHYQQGLLAMAIRLIPRTIPSQESLGFTEIMYQLTTLTKGLILVTGPSGSGKSTTLAAMIDLINQTRRCHIVTIEDPIEFVYAKRQGLIEQRQVGSDTLSFARALKYVARQDPNVILVGEMRDRETVQAVINAAEMGHLVLSTLHTPSAAETVERIIGIFEGSDQRHILIQLAAVLRAVIAQQLVPKKDGGLVASREILINTSAVATPIRDNRISDINLAIQTGAKEGMITMAQAIKKLYTAGVIDKSVAESFEERQRAARSR